MAVRVEFTVPDDMHERLESARGHEPRASFIKRALESALGQGGGRAAGPSALGPTRPSVSVRDD